MTYAVVIYAALSKKGDPDQASIESQIVKVRERLARLYADDALIVGTFHDDGHSGSKKNRGPGLEAAIAAVTRAADEHDGAELWANTSARFARGSGKRDEARALGALYYELRARGVAIRTVADDEYLSNEMLVGFASAQAAKYSADLSESVKRAKRRQAERGEHLGGPLALGYALEGKKEVVIDPRTEATVRRIFDLAVQGVPDGVLARTVNAEGLRTRNGRPFDRRAIQAIVTNAFYAARIVYEGEVFEAKHPAIIDAATFDRIQQARGERDLSAPHQHVVGRPVKNHALARLARCGQCGERMLAVTSTYVRKDGSRARSYVCQGYKFSTGLCDCKPINAEVVDAAVISGLRTLLVDFDEWRRRIQDGHKVERDRLTGEVERAERDLDAQVDRTAKVEAKWGDYIAQGDDDKANLVLPMVERERQALVGAERRLTAARDALGSVPVDAPADAMLDFATALQAAVRGRLDETGTMGEVNQALRETFGEFVLTALPTGAYVDDAGQVVFDDPNRPQVLVQPFLRPSVVHALADSDWPKLVDIDPPPPLRGLDAPDDGTLRESPTQGGSPGTTDTSSTRARHRGRPRPRPG